MKLSAFAALRAVIRGGTFAAAAVEMHVTPSAISMQMKQLEAFFGQPLFDRSGAHPRPTPLAFQVVQLMGEPLDGLDVLRKESDVQVRGTVRLGIIENLQAVVLPGAVRWLRRHHPGLELQLMRGRSSTLTAALKAGDIEAALVAQSTAGATATLHWTPVAKKALVLIAPPSVAETDVAALFRQYEWIRYDRSAASGTMAARFVHERIGDIRGGMELSSPNAIIAMVSAGLGVSILAITDPALLTCYPVRVIPLGDEAPVLQISLATRKLDADNRLIAALREAVQAVALETALGQ